MSAFIIIHCRYITQFEQATQNVIQIHAGVCTEPGNGWSGFSYSIPSYPITHGTPVTLTCISDPSLSNVVSCVDGNTYEPDITPCSVPLELGNVYDDRSFCFLTPEGPVRHVSCLARHYFTNALKTLWSC